MSLDVSVYTDACEHCGSDGNCLVDENITYNVAPIYYPTMRAVGIRGGLRGLDGLRLKETADQLRRALAFLDKHHDRLVQREPDNGWGGVRCVRRVLDSLLEAAGEGRDGVINVC